MDPGMQLDGGELQQVPGNASPQQQIGVLNEVIRRLNGLLRQQVFSDGSSRRMILGYQPNGWGAGKDFGIKISKPNIDVLTATDDQLLFKMDLATWTFWDESTGLNYMQFGKLPDGSGGFAVAREGAEVEDIFV